MVSKNNIFKNLLHKESPAKYWIFCIAIYISLIFSTGLFYAYGPEAVITMEYFFLLPQAYPLNFRNEIPISECYTSKK